jgi:dolichol kinase
LTWRKWVGFTVMVLAGLAALPYLVAFYVALWVLGGLVLAVVTVGVLVVDAGGAGLKWIKGRPGDENGAVAPEQ